MTYTLEPKKEISFSKLKYEDVITEHLNYTIYTQDEISKIKNAVNKRCMKKGKFVARKTGLGPDNPYIVGMPEYSNTLIYDRLHDRWILTDGLGNGWIR